MASKRKPSLAALARSRGFFMCGVQRREVIALESNQAHVAYTDTIYESGLRVYAPTRSAAEAGLRAALEALPPVKVRR